jgi:hypothetical protein
MVMAIVHAYNTRDRMIQRTDTVSNGVPTELARG